MVTPWPALFYKTKKLSNGTKELQQVPKWGTTLACSVDAFQKERVVVQTAAQLAELCQSRCIPFLVKHQRSLEDKLYSDKVREFVGLVTEAYTENNKLAFKVLYPYDQRFYSEGKLYKNVSGAACKMYSDYNVCKTAREKKERPCVMTTNSNGWEHLVCQVSCDAQKCNDHSPFEFKRRLHHIFPKRLRDLLQQNVACEFNAAVLPARVVVNHPLQLDHLALSDIQSSMSLEESRMVTDAVLMCKSLLYSFAQEIFPTQEAFDLFIKSMWGDTNKRTTSKFRGEKERLCRQLLKHAENMIAQSNVNKSNNKCVKKRQRSNIKCDENDDLFMNL